MRGVAALVVAAGLVAACSADDPLARPLPTPTMPAPDSPQPPLPNYVTRLDKQPVTVKIDPPGACAEGTDAGADAEDCR